MTMELHPENLKNCNTGYYIFFAPAIGDIGGGQLYLSAKVEWLESKGWNVGVYYTEKKDILLPNLKRFEKNHIQELTIRFSTYGKTDRERISNHLLDLVGYRNSGSVIIESYSFESALWGEYMARRCNGKHICYIIGEQVSRVTVTESMKNFLRFKLKQKFLYGITPATIPSVLPEAIRYVTMLRAEGCSQFNAPIIKDSRLETIPEYGFTILSVGRLEKPYMINLFKNVREFSDNVKVAVNFVVVGDTSETVLKSELFSILNDANNLRVSFWGFTYPIPRQLYERADVFVGCAGSANVAFKERVPTITIDASDYQGIGILGETTNNRLYRADYEPQMKIVDLLMQVFNEAADRREKRKCLLPIVEKPDFSQHQRIIDIELSNGYYPVENVKNVWWFDLIGKCLNIIIGKNLFLKLKKIKRMIKQQ